MPFCCGWTLNIPNISSGVFFKTANNRSSNPFSKNHRVSKQPTSMKNAHQWIQNPTTFGSIHMMMPDENPFMGLSDPSERQFCCSSPARQWSKCSVQNDQIRKDNPSQESQEVYKKYKKSVDFGAPHSKGKCFGPHTNCSTPPFNWKRW